MDQELFATQCLCVRRMGPSDLADLRAVYGDPTAMRWVDDGEPISDADSERWIEVTRENYRRRGYGMSVLTERERGKVVGFCGLVHPGGQAEVEIKYALLRSHWGRGLATEAVAGMLEYGWRAFGIERVMATTAPENHASHRVLEKCGFVRAERIECAGDEVTQVFRYVRPEH